MGLRRPRRPPTPEDEALRAQMVATQLRARGIEDERVLAAFARVPRHLFVDGYPLVECYADHPLPIDCDQTISQPYVVAVSLEAAAIRPEDRVLEIGAGSGYQTALLAELACQVCALEYHAQLQRSAGERLGSLGYANVDLRCGDGHQGWPEPGVFDAIIGSAAAARVPPALIAQLAPGGCLVMPVGVADQDLVRLRRTPTGVERVELLPVRFVPLLGAE